MLITRQAGGKINKYPMPRYINNNSGLAFGSGPDSRRDGGEVLMAPGKTLSEKTATRHVRHQPANGPRVPWRIDQKAKTHR